MISPSRASALLQPVMNVLLVVFIIGSLYTWLHSEDDYEDDDFTVTFTYDCNRVLTERNYPSEVLGECLELREEIKRRMDKR